MLFRRSQSAFCRLHALHHHVRGIGTCIHLSTVKVATASGPTKLRHWCTSIPILSSPARDRGQIQCVGTITSSPRIQIPTTMGTKQRASEMMMMAMMMMVSSGHSGAKFQEQMKWGQNRPRTTMLMAEI
jgi:hypothetical protein